jgi:hypothetical protein
LKFQNTLTSTTVQFILCELKCFRHMSGNYSLNRIVEWWNVGGSFHWEMVAVRAHTHTHTHEMFHNLIYCSIVGEHHCRVCVCSVFVTFFFVCCFLLFIHQLSCSMIPLLFSKLTYIYTYIFTYSTPPPATSHSLRTHYFARSTVAYMVTTSDMMQTISCTYIHVYSFIYLFRSIQYKDNCSKNIFSQRTQIHAHREGDRPT